MRWYRLILRLYPRSFRESYGAELEAVARSRAREAHGFLATMLFVIEVTADTIVSAAASHADIVRADLRSAFRTVRRSPAFAVTVMSVAALGIGATVVAFALTDHVLLRPLPFPEADRLLKLYQDQSFRGYSRMELSPPNFFDWQRESRTVEAMGAYTDWSANVLGAGEPIRLEGALVTGTVFSVLGVQPELGRALTSIDDRLDAPRALVISHGLWTSRFGGQPDALGQSVLIDDQPHTIVGVMPATFTFPSREATFWAPLRFEGELLSDRSNYFLDAIARRRAGVSIDEVRAEMNGIAAQLAKAYPDTNARNGATVIQLRDQVTRQARLTLWALTGASLCMLLIACTNLASLLLARALDHHRELSVRAALGAGRERLVRQLLTENVLLTAIGGLAGGLLAAGLVPFVTRLVPTSLPIPESPGVDFRLLGITALATAAAAVIAGLIPSTRLTRPQALQDGLREGARTGISRSTERLRSSLVVAQVTASMVLVICAGLLLEALWRVQGVDPGFVSDQVLTVGTSLPMPKYAVTGVRERFYDQVISQLRATPGVENAAYISFLPMVMRGGIWPVTVDGAPADPENPHMASLRLITPGFFDTLRVPLLAGRDFRADDRQGTLRVAIVSESFVKRHWPGLDAIGRRLAFPFGEANIAGVVRDIKVRGLERESEPQVYLASAQVPDNEIIYYGPKNLVVRTKGDLQALVPALRRIVATADPQVPLSDIRPLSEIVAADMEARVVQLRVLWAFAGLAVLLAAFGVHGVLACSVASRVREIGVRFALGATPGGVLRLVLGRGLWLAAAGVALGVVTAAWAASMLQSLLFGVDPRSAPVYGIAALVCLAMAAAGSLLPAVRAMRVNPVEAMRAE
ncbi:MAG TPA: ABC transporter permease [Vicinamibacterales bacterium]|nr:ABC transporter permease [Vicinamibacterales bacterium]